MSEKGEAKTIQTPGEISTKIGIHKTYNPEKNVGVRYH
jgi:hypothetical protein